MIITNIHVHVRENRCIVFDYSRAPNAKVVYFIIVYAICNFFSLSEKFRLGLHVKRRVNYLTTVNKRRLLNRH